MKTFYLLAFTITHVFSAIVAEPPPTPDLITLEASANASGATDLAWTALGNARMQEARNKVGHDFATAEAAFQKALTLRKDSTDAMLGMAWVKNSEHLFEQGRGWAEKALAIDPDLVDAHALLGDYAVELGAYDEAYDHYQAALDLRGDLSTFSRASHLLWITGDTSKAMLLMEKAIEAGGPYPENAAWCHVEAALMEFNLGAILASEEHTKKALEIAPENPRALAMKGRLLAAKRDYDGAISAYEKSVSIMPTHQPLAALVDLYHLKGDAAAEKKAIADVIEYHRPDPKKIAETLAKYGHIHPTEQASAELALFLADHDLDLDSALKEAEKSYETYKNVLVEDSLAWCFYKEGDFKKARLMIERAMKWNTREPMLHYHRGMIWMKLGDKETAANSLEEALALNPKFDPIHADIARKTLDDLATHLVPEK